jgi:dephospho-CoA kinase
MTLIGIAGKMGCGKDYICNNVIIPILKKYNETFLQIAFADQIKVNVMTINNIKYNDVYINKTTHTRKLLQIEGTEKGRNLINENIWINYFNNWITVFKNRGIDNFICTDVRFKNEIEYIKNQGGILIYINAPHRNMSRLKKECNDDIKLIEQLKSHASECDLDDLNSNTFDLIINNDSNDAENIKQIYNDFNDLYKLNKLYNTY